MFALIFSSFAFAFAFMQAATLFIIIKRLDNDTFEFVKKFNEVSGRLDEILKKVKEAEEEFNEEGDEDSDIEGVEDSEEDEDSEKEASVESEKEDEAEPSESEEKNRSSESYIFYLSSASRKELNNPTCDYDCEEGCKKLATYIGTEMWCDDEQNTSIGDFTAAKTDFFCPQHYRDVNDGYDNIFRRNQDVQIPEDLKELITTE